MTRVLIWGLRRSGTNYLAKLLRDNLPEAFEVTDRGGYWKHSNPRAYPELLAASGTSHASPLKDPYAYTDSRMRWLAAHHTPDGERPPAYVARLVAERWIEMARDLPRVTANFRLRDLIQAPERAVKRVAHEHGVTIDPDRVDQVERRVLRSQDLAEDGFNQEAYLDRAYLDAMGEEVGIVAERLRAEDGQRALETAGYTGLVIPNR